MNNFIKDLFILNINYRCIILTFILKGDMKSSTCKPTPTSKPILMARKILVSIRPGFHYRANVTTTTQKQSDYRVEQSSFTLIALFWLQIGRCRGCRGRNWLNGIYLINLINGTDKLSFFSV